MWAMEKSCIVPPLMTKNTMPYDLDLDVAGVQTLTIQFKTEDSEAAFPYDSFQASFRLLDARLTK